MQSRATVSFKMRVERLLPRHHWVIFTRVEVELKLQYFSHLMRKANSLEKTLMLGKIEGRRRRG